MISAQSLTKRFGSLTAVDAVSFEVGTGGVLGFIGPNGAGKTTTMRMLTGFLPASGGKAVVAGHDVFDEPMQVRRKVGYLPETPPLYRELSIGDYLRFVAEIRGIAARDRARRVGEVMEQVGLSGWERRIVGSLSKGYRQRVGLAQAIMHDPPVLILDEPTSGLDPAQVAGMRDFVRELANDRTVILSTHILSEVELLCPRVVMIAGGKKVADGTLDEVRHRATGGVRYRVELKGEPPDAIAPAVGALPQVDQVKPVPRPPGDGPHDPWDQGFRVLDVRAADDPRTAIARLATEQGWTLRGMERRVPGLEEAFLAIIGAEQ
ncbi:MAG: ABC transporter ATP-binding protein [Alphaproteobacteria bacterium]|nr:ABC transporter ATP-binding protein [Alphaproteobacteria bacterium]